MDELINQNIKQFIIFKLGKEEYGIDIKKITTIEQMKTITRVPKIPVFIKGVINLRGEIIPIMDLRTKFGLPKGEETEDSRIIIVKIEEEPVGIIVDAVAEVISLTDELIENVSNFSNDLSLEYILGVGKVDDRIITLLNIEKLVSL